MTCIAAITLSHYQHPALSFYSILYCSLLAAHVPTQLEPSGIYFSDDERPDGVTLVLWKSGKMMVWDATCPDTSGPSYAPTATREAGAVAAQAEVKKKSKYAHLDPAHLFVPVALEISRALGPRSREFLGHRLRQMTGEEKSFVYLIQRVSVAIQRGNAASELGTMSLADNLSPLLIKFSFVFPS